MAPIYGRQNAAIAGQISIMGHKVLGLVDTGATVSCVSHALWKTRQEQWGPLRPPPTTVLGADGAPLNITGITRELPVTWGTQQTSASFIVVKGLEKPQVILGMDILAEFKVTINTHLREALPQDNPRLTVAATI